MASVSTHARPIRGSVAANLVAVALGCVAVLTSVATNKPTVAATFGKAQTDRQTRAEAARSIPLAELTPEVRRRIEDVVSRPTIYRRLPVEIIDCDPDYYLFLIRHPEVVVNVWDLMGVTRIDLQRTGPFAFNASDGIGTTSQVELVYGNNDTHLFYGEGIHRGKLFRKPVRGRCVLLLKSGYVKTVDGRVHVTNQLDVFVQLERVTLDAIARVIHPFFGKTADSNFIQTVQFLERMSRTAERNSSGMERLASKLAKIDDSVRLQLLRETALVSKRARERDGASTQLSLVQ